MERRRIIVSGSVQGVGFRSYAKRLAERLSIVGTVQNLDDGSVEIVAQAEDLTVFLDGLRDGPGEVRDVRTRKEPLAVYSSFRIVS